MNEELKKQSEKVRVIVIIDNSQLRTKEYEEDKKNYTLIEERDLDDSDVGSLKTKICMY